jgi:hypothetical protein
MAFRLRPTESVAHGLRRLATRELRSAHEGLRRNNPPDDPAIHEARKSIKKVRAIAELIEADGGPRLPECRKRLRKVNRTLSDLRDTVAMQEALTKIRNKHPHLFDDHAFARIRRHLAAHKQASLKAAQDDGAWKKIDRQLRKLRRAARRWRPSHRRFGALAPGIRVAYRLGRKAMARAVKHRGATDFHEWRKHLKVLWYHLRLVDARSRDIRKDVELLHHAEAWLGDDHNVVVLRAELSKGASLGDLEQWRHAADRYQSDLRRNAIASTTLLYSHTPRDYVNRVKRAWKASRRRSKAHRSQRPRRAVA